MRTRAFKVSPGRKCNTQGSDCARGTYTNYMTPQHIPRARKSLQSRTLALKGFIYPDITVPEPFTTTPDRKTPPRSGKPLYTPIHPRARMYTPDTRVYPSYMRLPGSREFIMVPFALYPYILCYFCLYF